MRSQTAGVSFPFRSLLPTAIAAGFGLAPLAPTPLEVSVLARLVLSTLLFAAASVVLRAVPEEIIAVLPFGARQPEEPAP
jgi:hypothetical protein